MPKPTVMSLFAGCGGSSLGYQLAGCQVKLAVDFDPHAAQIYRDNHPNTPLIEGDLTQLDPNDLMSQAELQPGELAILDGSPPCQGFSMAGQRRVNDPRNQLFKQYVACLKALQPEAFVMENVPGLVTGRMRPVFYTIIQTLQACGYVVRARVLNAAHYGVPQNRQRLIVIGIRQDLKAIPEHPEPTHAPISLKQALTSLSTPGLVAFPTGRALTLAQSLRPGESGASLHRRYRAKGNDFSLIRLAWEKPSPTVCKTVRIGQCGLLHPDEHRFLGINELKRVSAFPDTYQFHGSFEQQWARIGNAVPPLLTAAVAQQLLKALGNQKEQLDA